LAINDTTITAGPSGFAAGRDISGNTINFGPTPEQLKEATEAAVRGAAGPPLDRITGIVTTEAAKTLLRIAGKQPDVPNERLADVLTKVANDYKRLQAQVAALNQTTRRRRLWSRKGRPRLIRATLRMHMSCCGQQPRCRSPLRKEARKLREQAQAAEDAQMLGAASSTATDGDAALTERNYKQAAELFGQAAQFVPAGHPDERFSYLAR
jgi:hypothetical protein